jgi:peptidoglycan hydrolase CwlO-like protein
LTASQTEINDRDEKITALNAQIEAANKSHNTQIAALSATIASLKAGTGVPKQENAPIQLPKEASQTEDKIVPIVDERLAGYLDMMRTATN